MPTQLRALALALGLAAPALLLTGASLARARATPAQGEFCPRQQMREALLHQQLHRRAVLEAARRSGCPALRGPQQQTPPPAPERPDRTAAPPTWYI